MPPADEPAAAQPRPEPRRRRDGRGRVVLIVGAIVLVVLLTSLRGIARFWTDYLWFDSLDQGGVFTGRLKAQATLVVLFTGIFFLLLWLNLVIADRLAPAYRPPGPEEELIERYRSLIGHRTGLVRAVVAVVFALIAGAGTSGQWNEWILFNNAVDFGSETDPLFHRDIGFYVFKLPFLSFAVGWLFASLVIVLIITIVAHYLNGGIRVQVPAAERVTAQVKVHVSVLLGLLALVRAGDYYLQRFELTVSTRGTVDGATYTDVNAQLPATNLLILIAFAAAVLFLLNTRRKGWVLPAMAVGIWAVVAVVGGAIVPAAVQRFRVQPAESSREREYISRNIEATRQAIGLADVVDQTFTPEFNLGADDLTGDNATIIDNIRIWDPATDAAGATFQSLQSIRNFYKLNDVDVDRYTINDRPTQVIVSARELDTSGVTDSWEAKHLTFTHGYGLIVAPTNTRDEDGRPSFLLSDIPLDEGPEELSIENPGLYFGEGLSGYVITNTKRTEIDFQDPDGEAVPTEYSGEDGVGIGSFLRRAAFALRFGDPNPIFSGNIDGDSRVLLQRDIRDRVRSLAPFLDFDQDPYPVVIDGKVQWIIDAYTTSDRFPYAQRAITDGLDDADLDHRFNYIRNSVKAVVDAYDGTVTMYVVDPTDPIIRAYAKAFPSLFTDEEPPPELAAHFRYPEDMFRVQSNMWGRYHLSDPDAFYAQNDSWVVARDPGRARQTTTSGSATTTGTTTPNAAPRQRNRIDPYYVLTRLPGQDELGFQIVRPFVPFSRSDNRQLLTAYLVAESDGDRYGRLTSYRVTGGDLPDGPGIVADSINGNAEVSQQQSLLCRQGSGSTCTFGNLILVPIADSLLYVQPLYVRADRADAPALLERVIVEYQGDVSIGDDLREALQGLPAFSGLPDEPEVPVEGNGSGSGGPPSEAPDSEGPSVAELLAQADAAFVAADEALRSGDLSTYQEKVDEARDLITEAQQLLSEQTGEAPPEVPGASSSTSSTSSTTTTSEPQSA